jgi:hypothetical protein
MTSNALRMEDSDACLRDDGDRRRRGGAVLTIHQVIVSLPLQDNTLQASTAVWESHRVACFERGGALAIWESPKVPALHLPRVGQTLVHVSSTRRSCLSCQSQSADGHLRWETSSKGKSESASKRSPLGREIVRAIKVLD